MRFIFPNKKPSRIPTLNEYTLLNRGNAGRFQANKVKQSTEELLCWYIREQWQGKAKPPVWIDITWVEENTRRDKDNIAFGKKFIFDALVKSGVLEDDGWMFIEGFSDNFKVDKENPRVEVVIKEIPNELI